MKKALAILPFIFSANAFAAGDIHLICKMGDAADMDIYIEATADNKERIKVVLTAMDGVTERVYMNSNFENNAASEGLKAGKIQAIVSKSDLLAVFGGAFLQAGMLELNTNPRTNKQDVNFAAEGVVFTAECAE